MNKTYCHWLPIMTFFLGTGCRVGEVIRLTWQDIDMDNKIISINHTTSYRPDINGNMHFSITSPKTSSSIRKIPIFKDVYDSLYQLKCLHDCNPVNPYSLQGYSDFVFLNRYGSIYIPLDINKAIKRIYIAANNYEKELSITESRPPVVIRHFTAHNLRHTFCTRLCEVENNVKLIMAIMGHSDIQTTMNIYNEIQDTKMRSSFEALEGNFFHLCG